MTGLEGRTLRHLALGLLLLAAAGCGSSLLQPSDQDRRSGHGGAADALAVKKFKDSSFLCNPVAQLAGGSALGLADPVTYKVQIAPLLAKSCALAGCHAAGATAPDLSTYATAKAAGAASLQDIQSSAMPVGGTLAATDKALFKAWVDGGYLEAPAAPSPVTPAPPSPETPAVPAYNDQIKGLLTKSCALSGCHVAGATAPDLSNYAAAKAAASDSLAQIQGGVMPTSGALADADQALFKAWVDGGLQEGTVPPAGAASTGASGAGAAASTPLDRCPVPDIADKTSPAPDSSEASGGQHLVNYQDDVQPLLTKSCALAGCHIAGATAPDLSNYAAAKASGAASLQDIQNGVMPVGGMLTDADKALFVAWAAGGYAEKGN